MRGDGRKPDEIRPFSLECDVNLYAEGSCIVSMGATRVHCTASLSDTLPRWRRESGQGWITAEYRMLPRATHTRTNREGERLKGRTSEIQRLIGRSLRAAVDLKQLGAYQLTIDCDVLQADGGTRTASINGGFVAMAMAIQRGLDSGMLERSPLVRGVAGMSMGIIDGSALLDLCYDEDSGAEVDLNAVLTNQGELIEVQGTAEGAPFSTAQLQELLELAQIGAAEVFAAQAKALPLLRTLLG
jgi:ribonuclease PH